MTAAPRRPGDDFRYMPNHYATTYEAGVVTFDAACPDCGRVVEWTDSKADGPRPGDCDCDIERNAA